MKISNEIETVEIVVPFKGVLTKSQYYIMQKLARPWWTRFYVLVPCLFYTFVSIGVGWTTLFKNPYSAVSYLIEAAVVTSAIMLFDHFFRNRAWRRTQEIQGEIYGVANEGGIEWNSSLTSSKYPWNKLLKAKESSEMILVFITPRNVFYFPRKFFASENEWEMFKLLVCRKLSKL